MPQPIEEGMVLGGRYLVTGHVLTSADQDMVLDGRDQVLNRDVSILVASSDHASQVAASARELATGERQGSVQVLDLGLSEGRTYLIAGGSPEPDELLDMTREQQVYVEPFQTDTLGSEIFGEARAYEPHVYEDDEEYYEDLDDTFAVEGPERRRPRFLKGISERLTQRLGSHDAARDAVSDAGAAGAAAGGAAGTGQGPDDGRSADDGDVTDPYRSAIRRTHETPLPDTVSDDEWTGTHDEVAVPPGPRTPATGFNGASDTNTVEAGVEPHSAADTGEGRRADVVGGATAGAAAAAAAAVAGTGPATAAAGARSTAGAEAAEDRGTAPTAVAAIGRHSPKPGRPHLEDPDVPSPRPKVSLWSDGDEEYQDEDKPRGARWIVGGILALVLILGAVFAFNLLGDNREPQAGHGGTTSAPAGNPTDSQTAGSDLPTPVIAGATRLVPDNPQLSAETDNTLPNAIDGNPATAWQTYKFAQPVFGGYASSMALVIELEEPSAISQVDIVQNNGSGGSFSVLLNDAPRLEGARQIAEGSFTGPQVSVPVSGENGAPAEAQYVIIDFTELPELSNASANLPYGLRIAEVRVQ